MEADLHVTVMEPRITQAVFVNVSTYVYYVLQLLSYVKKTNTQTKTLAIRDVLFSFSCIILLLIMSSKANAKPPPPSLYVFAVGWFVYPLLPYT